MQNVAEQIVSQLEYYAKEIDVRTAPIMRARLSIFNAITYETIDIQTAELIVARMKISISIEDENLVERGCAAISTLIIKTFKALKEDYRNPEAMIIELSSTFLFEI